MKKAHINRLESGDILEQNVYRHDSLLALAKGTKIKVQEKNYLKALQLEFIYASSREEERIYNNKETLEIIKDALYSCTLWDHRVSKKIYESFRSKVKKYKELLKVLTLIRQVDHYTFVSSINIAFVVSKMMMVDNKFDRKIADIFFYALVHDVGKIKVSKITNKASKLTEQEFALVRQHPIFSYKLLLQFGLESNSILYAMQTHERFDGNGYPQRLIGNDIEPLAQIIAIAEMYNALSSIRPHRAAFYPVEVKNKISQEEDRAFGSSYVRLFAENFTPYRKGVEVELANGLKGIVVETNPKAPLFPRVQVYDPETKEVYEEINLNRQKDLWIARVIV